MEYMEQALTSNTGNKILKEEDVGLEENPDLPPIRPGSIIGGSRKVRSSCFCKSIISRMVGIFQHLLDVFSNLFICCFHLTQCNSEHFLFLNYIYLFYFLKVCSFHSRKSCKQYFSFHDSFNLALFYNVFKYFIINWLET